MIAGGFLLLCIGFSFGFCIGCWVGQVHGIKNTTEEFQKQLRGRF